MVSETELYDIAIVGAGVAGLSGALSANKNHNVKIVLIEGRQIGSNQTSPLTFTDVVKDNDLMDCVKGHYSSFAFHNHQGSKIEYDFKEYPLVLLDYEKACLKMYQKIEKKGDNFKFINHYARDIIQVGRHVQVTLDDDRRIETKLLVDCSGNYKSVQEQDGKTTKYFSLPYGGIFSGIENIRKDKAFFLWPHGVFGLGGGWFYPLSDERVSFGYASISNSPIVNIEELKKNFLKAVDNFEPYSYLLKDAKLEYIENGVIPITYKKNLVSKNTIFVGDAAGMATSWTCMGVEPAIKYGKLAGQIAAEAIMKDDPSILGAFQKIWDDDNKSTYDQFNKNSASFWSGDHYFWEWIIKNDLAYLSPLQLLNRMRKNEHLMKRKEIFLRALKYKAGTLMNKDLARPQNITIE